MTTDTYIILQKFNNKAEALMLGDVLKENQVDYLVENSTNNFDPTFSNNELSKEYRVKVKDSDIDKAEAILKQLSLEQLEEIDNDYFLYKFSDEELFEVIAKADEWSKLDGLLAQKILSDRGKTVTPEDIELFNKHRLTTLARPEDDPTTLIYAGYVFAVLGGALGFIIGWALVSYKKTLPNRSRVYAHSEKAREHGQRIILISVAFAVFWILKFLW